MHFGEKSLLGEFAWQLRRISGVDVPMDAWQLDTLPPHLSMCFRLLDSDGRVMEQGRDLDLLQAKYADRVEESLSQSSRNPFERDDITHWNFGDLPESVDVDTAGVTMQGFPALQVMDDGSIALRLFASREAAEEAMHFGLRALLKKVLSDEVKYLRRKLPGIQQLCLRFAPFGSCEELTEDIINASIDQSFITGKPRPRTHDAFAERLREGKPTLVVIANGICETLADVFERYRKVSKRLSGSVALTWIEPAEDIQAQIRALIFNGFVSATPARWLARYPAYFEAIDKRLDAIDQAPDKDRRRRAEFLPLWKKFTDMPVAREHVSDYANQLEEVRWLIEELRVSLFAQAVGTPEKVSVKRLENRLEELRKR